MRDYDRADADTTVVCRVELYPQLFIIVIYKFILNTQLPVPNLRKRGEQSLKIYTSKV